MMKQITGSVLFALGMLMATGVDENFMQCIYALVLIGAGAVCMKDEKLKIKD